MSFLSSTRDSKGDAGVLKTLNTVNSLVRTILSLAILAAIGTGAWLAYQHFAEKWSAQRELQKQEARIAGLSKDVERKDREIDRLTGELLSSHEQIDRLEIDVQAKQREIERLDTALRLMKVDHRVAQIDVLAQEGSRENGDLVTHFSFVELDKEEGTLLEVPRLFSIKGDVVYLDALVVKFDDEYVEMGDPLRSTSLFLFRRIFAETQEPSEGYVLDQVGSQPTPYRTGGKMSDMEREIWAKFWEYATDPVKAHDAGIRAAHGEAVSQKLIPGKRYKVLLRASGGLTLPPPVDLPPEAKSAPAETL